jgi:hypothetical protein
MLRALIVASAVFAAGAPSAAQSTDQLVETIASLARDNLGHARPIVPAALDQQTVRRGALTAQVQACGGPWQKASYLPYMAQLRASHRYSEQQLTYVGIVHGITQQLVFSSLAARAQPCPARTRAALGAALAR